MSLNFKSFAWLYSADSSGDQTKYAVNHELGLTCDVVVMFLVIKFFNIFIIIDI
jgi:hypothetical protein